jgi:hypothetical protein
VAQIRWYLGCIIRAFLVRTNKWYLVNRQTNNQVASVTLIGQKSYGREIRTFYILVKTKFENLFQAGISWGRELQNLLGTWFYFLVINSMMICFGRKFQQKYEEENVIFLFHENSILLSNMRSCKSFSLKSCFGAESFSQVFDIISANGFQKLKALSNIPRFHEKGGLLQIISQCSSGSYV